MKPDALMVVKMAAIKFIVAAAGNRLLCCLFYLLTVLISISSGIDNHSASIQVCSGHLALYVISLCCVC